MIEKSWIHTTGQYKSWSIKIIPDESTIKNLKDNLRSRGPLGPGWTGQTITDAIDFKVTTDYVHDQLHHMDDPSFRGGLEDKIKNGHYPFTYDGEEDPAPDPGHHVDNFNIGKYVAVEFQVYGRDMPASANFTGVRDYSFQLQSVYLIGLPKPKISTPKNRKRGPDEWLIAPPRTSKSKFEDSPLEWSVKKAEHGIDEGDDA